MRKLSKILVIALMIMAVAGMFSNAKAANKDLLDYIGTVHNINGMLWELSNDKKQELKNLAAHLDDATSDSIMNDIIAAEMVVRNSGVTNHNNLTAAQQAQIVAYAQSAASKAGATLTVDLNSRTYTLTKGGKTIASAAKIDKLIVDPGTATTGGGSSSSTTTKTGKLLYTGANYTAYIVSAIAIVAIALVVKKKRV